MPAANRHEPKRARFSTYEYAVTQFQRDSPGDAAYLEHLWRTCMGCGHHAHPTAGTISHKSSISLHLGNLKTGMRAAYKQVSRKWPQSYLDECAWRHSQRCEPRGMFMAMVETAARARR